MKHISGIQLALVDDDPVLLELFRDRLAQHDEFAPPRLFSNGRDAYEALRSQPADVVLVDLHMPGETGIAVIRALRFLNPSMTVIAFTADSEDSAIREALQAGAEGFLWKEESLGRLVEILRGAAAGRAQLSPTALRFLIREIGPRKSRTQLPQLTRQENRVLELTADGASCRQVAATLGVGLQTIYKHNKNILRKLGVRNRSEAIGLHQRSNSG